MSRAWQWPASREQNIARGNLVQTNDASTAARGVETARTAAWCGGPFLTAALMGNVNPILPAAFVRRAPG